MSNDKTVAQRVDEQVADISDAQVADYLRAHPEFFIENEDLLAELLLPHESGKAISLLERQVAILRNHGTVTRVKLNNLLDNARNNDQLFESTRDLVLALLRSRDANEIIQVAQDRLSHLDNIDACELILVKDSTLNVANNIRCESSDELQKNFADVFRLKRTHCGALDSSLVSQLFPAGKSVIRSTAVCPILAGERMLGILALGNKNENYFNLNLDTLFLDFIGSVIGAILSRETVNNG